MTRSMAIATLAVTIGVAPAAAQRDCRYEATRAATIQADASDRLDLIARAGSLTVRGVDGLAEVQVRGQACASSEELLDQLQIETGRSGGIVRVEVPEIDDRGSLFRNRYAQLHLEINVPLAMAADIQDGSGDLRLERLGDVQLEDGSGGIEATGMLGDLVIDDGSGDLRVNGADGSVTVEDGSGGIDLRDVAGDVRVEDGSGSIVVVNVGGDLVVERDGSGGIRHEGVRGRVDIPRRRH